MNQDITKAVQVLNRGGIVIFPTDTAFGIGCRIDREDSIKRLFSIRHRPDSQAMPVLVNSTKMAEEYAFIPEDVKFGLMDKYWPGALTIVLRARVEKTSELVRGGSPTIGQRMPNHQAVIEIINQVGVPILGPSANFHTEQTPYSFEMLDKKLLQLVDFVLPGNCIVKEASTVIDITVKPWRILREGAIEISNFK